MGIYPFGVHGITANHVGSLFTGRFGTHLGPPFGISRGGWLALYSSTNTVPALVQDSDLPIKSGKRNPCLHRDLHGMGRNSFLILTDTPEPISLALVHQPRIHQRSMGALSGSDGKTPNQQLPNIVLFYSSFYVLKYRS